MNRSNLEGLSGSLAASDDDGGGGARIGSGGRVELADAPMLLRSVEAGGFVRGNAAFAERVGFSNAELGEAAFLEWICPEDREVVRELLGGGGARCSARHRTRDGESLRIQIQRDDRGQSDLVLCRSAASSPPPSTGSVGASDSMGATLAAIAHIVEEQNSSIKCSILLITDGHFVSGAGPSLPDFYNEAIDGKAIGPTVGSCGTAIYWNVPVIVEDIQVDPLWAPLAELADRAGVAACWSHPFTSQTGRVLGALAFYSAVPNAPTAEQISRLRLAARMTGLAVERGLAEEELLRQRLRKDELERQLRQAAKLESLGVLAGGIAHDFNNILTSILGTVSLAESMMEPASDLQELMTMAVEGARRGAGLTQQLLTFSKGGEPVKALVVVEEVLATTKLALRGGQCPVRHSGTRGLVVRLRRPLSA